jgi:hypothetical protein
MNTQTNPVRFTNQKSTIIKMVVLTLLMTINLVTMGPIAADAAPAERANPGFSVENYQFSKTDVHEVFSFMGHPRGADYPGIGSGKSCHPAQKVRQAVAEKQARQKAVQNLDPEFGCDYYWETEHDSKWALPSCEEECSDPYMWAENGLLDPANGDEVVEVLRAGESSEVRVKTYSTASRGCVYAEAVAQDTCGCDCEAKLKYSRNP